LMGDAIWNQGFGLCLARYLSRARSSSTVLTCTYDHPHPHPHPHPQSHPQSHPHKQQHSHPNIRQLPTAHLHTQTHMQLNNSTYVHCLHTCQPLSHPDACANTHARARTHTHTHTHMHTHAQCMCVRARVFRGKEHLTGSRSARASVSTITLTHSPVRT